MYNLELFDRVADHLRKQNAKSVDADSRCFYRGPNGLKCAVGFLITDEAYSEDIESMSADSVEVCAALEKSGIKLDLATIGMLLDLQFVHDRYPVYSWAEKLSNLRHNFVAANKLA